MNRCLAAALLVLALLLGGCAARPAGADFRERLLATIPEDARVAAPADFSADGRTAAWVMQRDETSRAVRGAWTGKPYGVVC